MMRRACLKARAARNIFRPILDPRFQQVCRMTTDTETAEPTAQTHPFQAEVAELLRLMVHAVYSETDMFLRELISNASDACDKLRYEAIAQARPAGATAARWRSASSPTPRPAR